MKKYLFPIAGMLLATCTTGCSQTKNNAETTDGQDAEQVYYGDSLTTIGQTTYYFTSPADTPEAGDADKQPTGMILAMNGTDTVATCTIYGRFSRVLPHSDKDLRVTYGADETTIPLNPLPERFEMPVSQLSNAMNRISRAFKYNPDKNATQKLDFDVCYYSPSANNAALNRLVGNMLNELWDNSSKPFAGDYADTDAMMNYYADAYRAAYKQDYVDAGVDVECAVTLKAEPVWQSADKKLITYRFETYTYAGGAHGMYQIFYLTCDAKTFRPIDMAGIFRENKLAEVLDRVAGKLNEWRQNNGIEADAAENASLGDAADFKDEDASSGRIVIWHGKVYPRPALTTDGVVFSYQPYEKGSYAEGDVHARLSYDELKDALSPQAATAIR